MEWNDSFMDLFRNAVERYHERPQTSIDRFFLPEEVKILADMGYQPAEMHAYIQEYAVKGDPSPSTILLIAAARRSFFITQQRGISGNARPVRAIDLPPETDDFQEIAYLPRIISKAAAKLFGTLDPSIMYYDEKDRLFLREHGNIHPADFLYLTWQAHGDKQKMVSAVLNAIRSAQQQPPATPPPSSHPTQAPIIQRELNLE
ncbi:MAG: hypothetical protein IJB31_01850 [Akkermansia sp.]|nr:hypothetical protein [Akkermansia sp.]